MYQVLVFEQINRKNNGDEYLRLSKELLGILNGNFTIQWEGEIYTYWINRDSETEEQKEIKELGENAGIPTNQIIFGQQGIKELLTGKTEGEMISYEPVLEEEPGGEEEWMEPEETEVWRKTEELEGTEERKELEKAEGAAERTESEETITDEEPGKRRETEEQRKSDIRKELEKSEETAERKEPEETKETEKWTESETDKKSGEWMEPDWWKEVHHKDRGFLDVLDKLDKKEPEKNKITPNNFEKPMEPKESEDTTKTKEQEQQPQKQFRLDENQKVEVLLGKSKLSGEKITWNYTNRAMANRHLLITGKSGQGKTYAIQSFLMEFSKAGIPAIIFDYTEGFTTKKLDDKFKEQLQGKIKQNILKITRMPINPFLRQKINICEVVGEEILAEMTEEQIRQHSKEDSVAVASRIASILCHVYTFGDQQYATIYQVCKRGIDAYGDDMNFEQFPKTSGRNEYQRIQNRFKQINTIFRYQSF